MGIAFVIILVICALLLTAGLCKAAKRADNFSDAVYKSLQKEAPPAPPPPAATTDTRARARGLRIVN